MLKTMDVMLAKGKKAAALALEADAKATSQYSEGHF